MKRGGQWYMVVNSMGLRASEGVGEELTLRLANIAPLWYYQIKALPRGLWEGKLLDGDRRVKFQLTAPDKVRVRTALDCFMRDVALPRGVNVSVRDDRRPANSCIYCQEGIPGGMPYCRRSACLIKAQINLQTKGHL